MTTPVERLTKMQTQCQCSYYAKPVREYGKKLCYYVIDLSEMGRFNYHAMTK